MPTVDVINGAITQSKSKLYTTQQDLLNQLQFIFPEGTKPQVNVRKEYNLTNLEGNHLELDIWIPEHHLAFEFQDIYHYVTAWYTQSPSSLIQHQDEKKSSAVKQRGESLVVVPCWWDGSANSLSSAINFVRPDLNLKCQVDSLPFSLNPTSGFFSAKEVPDVGELMAASFPVNLNFYLNFPSNTWWIGEKYDGVRCCWNATRKSMYARSGGEIEMPSSFFLFLPSTLFLDGELWFGRGFYSSTYSFFNNETDPQFSTLRVISFDVPSKNISGVIFEERYKYLLANVSSTNPLNIVAPRVLGVRKEHLEMLKKSIIEDGGEGLILRKVNSLYEHGKSFSLLKLKTSYGDKEAIVVGMGDHKDVKLKLPSGAIFTVPSHSVHVPHLKSGDIVSFSYEIHSRRDIPSSPQIYRVRNDLSWADVVYHSPKDASQIDVQLVGKGFSSKPQRYWSHKNMRALLETFAKRRGVDPLLPQSWYSVSERDIRRLKGGDTVVRKFKGYVRALCRLFPEVSFDTSLFRVSPRYKWRNVTSRRSFFENYARANGFDPLVPTNWTALHKENILAMKGITSVLRYHKDSVARAINELFAIKVKIVPASTKPLNVSPAEATIDREFFISYARDNNFDPLVPSNWYSLKYKNIYNRKGRSALVEKYKGIYSALVHLFPDIGLDKSRFHFIKHRWYWEDQKNRRDALDQFAKTNNFDPLVPHNWYAISATQIRNSKFAGVLKCYRSFREAVKDVYPELQIDASKFVHSWPVDPGRVAKSNDLSMENKTMQNRVKWGRTEEARLLAIYPLERYLSDVSAADRKNSIQWRVIAQQANLPGRNADAIRDKFRNFKKLFESERSKKKRLVASSAIKFEASISFLSKQNS